MDGKFKRALVIGTGMMGPGIAITLARGGLEVKLAARTLPSSQRRMDSFRANLKILRENGLITTSEAQTSKNAFPARQKSSRKRHGLI